MTIFAKTCRKSAAALALSLALALAGPASATLVQIVYTGTVTEGFDYSGVLGTANTDLTGAAFRSVFIFDTSLGQSTSSPQYESLRGGTDYGVASPLVSSTFQIGSAIVSTRGDVAATLYAQHDGDESDVELLPSDQFADAKHSTSPGAAIYETEENGAEIQNATSALPNNYDIPFSYQVAPGDVTFGEFLYYRYALATQTEAYAYAHLAVDTLTIGPLTDGGGPVPEPASWALMILGFGGVGAMLRRRSERSSVPMNGAEGLKP